MLESATPSTELFDGTRQQWSVSGSLAIPRAAAASAVLPDGRLLVVGGRTPVAGQGTARTATAEIYVPDAAGWFDAGSMIRGRSGHVAVALADGRVLVAGGGPAPTSAEIYIP